MIVLRRATPEESVLTACKDFTQRINAANRYDGCKTGQGNCSDCKTLADS